MDYSVPTKARFIQFTVTVKPEFFATVLFSLISRVQKIRENKK